MTSRRIPGNGIKKPLNMLETPIYPDISRILPKVRWSEKHWTVNAGDALRQTETMNNFWQDAVLAVSRDYNKTVYGQNSYREIVNAAFRPPLLDPIKDFVPLTRIPATCQTIVPRLNPGTADNETAGYRAKNNWKDDVEKALTDRVQSGQTRPTFFCNFEVPVDNSVLPDLEKTLPHISASAGHLYPTIDAPHADVHLDFKRLSPSGNPGITTGIRIDGEHALDGQIFDYINPQISGSAGTNNIININGDMSLPDLDYVNPQVSTIAGTNTFMKIDGEHNILGRDFNYNIPQVSSIAGFETKVRLDGQHDFCNSNNLDYNILKFGKFWL